LQYYLKQFSKEKQISANSDLEIKPEFKEFIEERDDISDDIKERLIEKSETINEKQLIEKFLIYTLNTTDNPLNLISDYEEHTGIDISLSNIEKVARDNDIDIPLIAEPINKEIKECRISAEAKRDRILEKVTDEKTERIQEPLREMMENAHYFRNDINIFEFKGNLSEKQREQIYANGKNLFQLFDQYITKFKQQEGLNFSEIATKFNISEKQLRAWRIGRSPIPLKALKTITKELNIDKKIIENEIEELSSSRGNPIKIPRITTPKLVEIFGRYCGDGSCGIYKGGDYKFSLKEKGKEFVKLHSEDMNSIFGIKGGVINYANSSENVIRSKPLVLLFQKIFEYKDDFNKTFDIKPPHFLKDLDWIIRKHFTTGLIDTEGSFYYDNSSQAYFFEIKMKNSYLNNEVKTAFDEFGIPYNYYQPRPNTYRIRISNRWNIKLIKEIFEPKNKRHLDLLERFGI